MSMKMRTTVAMVGASIAYVLLMLPMGRVRAQGPAVPATPAAPAFPAKPAMPAMPAFPAEPAAPAMPAAPAFPAMPAMPAMPAFPAEPAAPAVPGWGEYGLHGSTPGGEGPSADCSDVHIRLEGERPTIQSEERTVSKAEAPVLRVREVENGGV